MFCLFLKNDVMRSFFIHVISLRFLNLNIIFVIIRVLLSEEHNLRILKAENR